MIAQSGIAHAAYERMTIALSLRPTHTAKYRALLSLGLACKYPFVVLTLVCPRVSRFRAWLYRDAGNCARQSIREAARHNI